MPIEHMKDEDAKLTRDDAALMLKGRQVPHECDDPGCPGNITRKKLKALSELLEASAKVSCALDPVWTSDNGPIVNRMNRAIAVVIDIDADAAKACRDKR